MDGWRSGRRRWAYTTEGGGARSEKWTAIERPSPAVKGGTRLGLVESNSNEARSDACYVWVFFLKNKIKNKIKNKTRGFWFVSSSNEEKWFLHITCTSIVHYFSKLAIRFVKPIMVHMRVLQIQWLIYKSDVQKMYKWCACTVSLPNETHVAWVGVKLISYSRTPLFWQIQTKKREREKSKNKFCREKKQNNGMRYFFFH